MNWVAHKIHVVFISHYEELRPFFPLQNFHDFIFSLLGIHQHVRWWKVVRGNFDSQRARRTCDHGGVSSCMIFDFQ